MMKFFALVALTVFATANAGAGSVTWGTTTPSTLVAGATPTTLSFVITASASGTIAHTSGTITVTPSSAIFAADGDTSCTAAATTNDGSTAVGTNPTFKSTESGTAANKGVVSGTAGTQIITFTMGTANTDILDNSAKITITCTDNLAANAATALVVTFGAVSTGDTTAVTGQTGYTLKTAATAFSATRGGSYLTLEAPGALVFSFTPTTALAAGNTIKLTSNVKLFTADNTQVACTATYADIATGTAVPTFAAANTKATGTGKILTLTLGATALTDIFPVTKAATITCASATGSLNNMDVNTAAGAVTFSFETEKDLEGLVDQTGYTICAATGCTTSAASSTASVGMLTMLALAGVAMRQ